MFYYFMKLSNSLYFMSIMEKYIQNIMTEMQTNLDENIMTVMQKNLDENIDCDAKKILATF